MPKIIPVFPLTCRKKLGSVGRKEIDYILVKKRFRSGNKAARTRTFPGADIGSDHDLEKLNDPTVMSAFQATIGGRFAPLATLVDEDADLDSMVTHFNKAVTDTAAELLGKQRRKRKLWVTPETLDLCDQRRDLKKKRGEPERAKDYREIKRKVQVRDEDGKRDLDTESMPGSRSMPQKE